MDCLGIPAQRYELLACHNYILYLHKSGAGPEGLSLFAMSGTFVPFCSDANHSSFGMHLKSE